MDWDAVISFFSTGQFTNIPISGMDKELIGLVAEFFDSCDGKPWKENVFDDMILICLFDWR